MTDRDAAAAVIACWRYMEAKPSAGRRSLYDAVNELWATIALQENIR